jgi:hypothetical protein
MSHHQNARQNHDLLINTLKMWQNTNIWGQQQQNKTAMTKKLRTD